MASSFFSTGQNLKVLLFFFFSPPVAGEKQQKKKTKQRGVTVPGVGLVEGALGGGGFFGLWKHKNH